MSDHLMSDEDMKAFLLRQGANPEIIANLLPEGIQYIQDLAAAYADRGNDYYTSMIEAYNTAMKAHQKWHDESTSGGG